MSLHNLAQHMAARGRGPDTMLVHMAPDEVQGLQQLALARGGSLTINPDTGLVEAFSLSDLDPSKALKSIAKPIVGGINDLLGPAAAPIMGAVGMAFGVPPEVTAAIWGGMSGLATGSLKQGVLAGAGAYGGANLYQGLTTAGATATADAAANQAIDTQIKQEIGTKAAEQAALDQSAAESARLGLSQEPFNAAAQQTVTNANAMGPSIANPTAPMVQTATATPSAAAPIAPAPAVTPPPTAPAPSGIETALTNAGKSASDAYAGLKDITVGGGGLDSLAAAMPAGATTGLKTSAALAAAPMLAAAMTPKTPDDGAPDLDTAEYKGMLRPWEFSRSVKDSDLGTQYTGKEKTGERNWFDDYWKQLAAYKAPGPEYKAATGGPVPAYASGGLGDLGGYSDGGRMLKGPGDGMSDSIPAQIGGKQPARLADGEFVVPADVVSHLGNGSTDAGAKQLYKMMDRVRTARTGKKKQAPAVKTGKFMPA